MTSIVRGAAAVLAGLVLVPGLARAQSSEVTFARDIAPILQRSCQNCHRPDGVAPMSLVTYEEVRPWARAIKQRTGIGPRAGVMPPWYVEREIGIQHFKDDPSLSPEEIQKIATWADNGAPLGNVADMPAPRVFADSSVWSIGTPDLIINTEDLVVKAGSPDWWGEIPSVPTGLTEDRYVAAVEVKEVNDVPSAGTGRETVGGRYVFHHMIYRTEVPSADGTAPDTLDPQVLASGRVVNWPVHEVGRNADFFDPKAAPLLKAGSVLVSDSVHLHSNGRDTKARLQIGFKFMPKDYKPEFRQAFIALGNGVDIDIQPMTDKQELHAYTVLEQPTKIVTFEPHLHAPGMRMCLEAIWGYNIQTLNCVGYDHNWVRGYAYEDDYAPILPKGTILHIIGYMDNTPNNRNIPDPRNWQGSGNRSVANMFIDLGMRVTMTDEQFRAEMQRRIEKARTTGQADVLLGCPLCGVLAATTSRPQTSQNQNQNQQN